jgi:hypothetical protein
MCSIEEETFNHIWICNSRSLEMLNLISKFKEELITIINDNILENYNKISYNDINFLGMIWNCIENDTILTFIDLIKGIIPLSLITLISKFISSHITIKHILYQFRQNTLEFIYKDYWNLRCDKLKQIDRSLEINKKIMKEQHNKEHGLLLHLQFDIYKYLNVEGLYNQILFGKKALSYYDICVPG